MEEISNLSYLRFSLGGYFSCKFEIFIRKKSVTYFADRYRYNQGIKCKKKISSNEIESFITKLNLIRLTKWKDVYDSTTLDGEQWELKLTYNNKPKRSIYGSNCYPSYPLDSTERSNEFILFLDAITQLIAEPDFFNESFCDD
jgi:hypothetical protein